MTRRSWFILLFLAVLITFGIVFILSRSSANENVSEEGEAVGRFTERGTSTQPQEENLPQIQGQPAAQNVESSSPAQRSSDVTGASHFVDCAFRTDRNAVIGIPKDVIQSGGVNLEPGDEIAVFTPDGTICVGAAVWTGENVAIAAWGDKGDTELIEGLQEDDQLRFRIWDQSTGNEMDISTVTYLQGDGFYIADGIYVVESMAGG